MSENIYRNLKSKFEQVFNKLPQRVFFSPGRVNLIGEHTDYNGGYVFPCAISYGTYVLVSLRDDDAIHAISLNFESEGILTSSINDIRYDENKGWLNYVLGVVKTLQNHEYTIDKGFDILISGNIPNGAGLSSSASLELAVAFMLNEVFKLGITRVDMAKFSQESENKFNGVNCGIMDQFIVAVAKKNNAIILNCNTLEYRHIPFDIHPYKLIIINTNKRRELSDSLYNDRRSSCERAYADINASGQYSCLSDVCVIEFEKFKNEIKNSEDRLRASHVIYENARVMDAKKALEEEDLDTFGQLMNRSHKSLKDIYEVTGKELDTIVDLSQHFGVIGARMTGAGFGGCAIAIVKEDKVDEYQKYVADNYEKEIGYAPTFYICDIDDGVREITK